MSLATFFAPTALRGLPSRQSTARERVRAADGPSRVAIVLTYAATLYSLLLCFLNTRVATMPNAALVLSEGLIAVGAAAVIAARLNLGMLLLMLCVCANFLALTAFQQDVDAKALRDLLLPLMFVALGYIVQKRELTERVLRNISVVAVVLGLIEFIFPTFYGSLFDALAFYRARGFGGSNIYALSVLQVRPGGIGRSLLPFLGPRRISSLFLEPVALGNFAVLTAAWALSKPATERRQAVWLLALAAAMIVMADARFGSITIIGLCLVRVTRLWRLRIVAGLLPVAAMLLLVLVTIYLPVTHADNVLGRFQVSGGNLLQIPWTAWLGVPDAINMDAGYGYIVQRTGIVICALLWAVYSIVPLKDDQARCFHFNAAIYIALNLCISGSSLFALKTTAVLWFLLGSIVAHEATRTRGSRYSPLFTAPTSSGTTVSPLRTAS